MKLKRYNEGLQAQMGEAGAGSISFRVEYERYDVDGKFEAFSHVTQPIEHTGQTTLVDYNGVDDGDIHRITGIYVHNSDASNVRTIKLYRNLSGVGVLLIFRAEIPIGGTFVYTPDTGFRVYTIKGLLMSATPV